MKPQVRPIDPAQVAIYIRWSTEDQGQGHTLAIQREACTHYCLSQGWTVQDQLIYIDEGWSGGTIDRPALSRLRAAVASEQVQAVIVYKLDRLSRNIKDIVALVLDEWEDRCAVRSTLEPIDTASDTGKLTFALLSSFADFERGVIRARTLSGKHKNAEQGRNAGMPYAYGYERGEEAGIYRVVEPEAAVVRTVFDLYLHGMGCAPIARHLNASGISNRATGPGRRRLSPGRWSSTAVLRILRNPIYTGRMTYNRVSRNPRRRQQGQRYYMKNDPAEVIRVRSPHIPAIIDDDTFDKVAQIRKAKQSPNLTRRAANSPHLLTGMIWCWCGHSLVGRKQAAKMGNYYWCSGRKNKGAGVCRSGMIQAEALDRLVIERLGTIYGSATAEAGAERQEVLRQKRQTVQHLLKTTMDALNDVRLAQGRLVRDYSGGEVSGGAYQHLYDSLLGRARQLENTRENLQQQSAELTQVLQHCGEQARASVTLRDSFAALTTGQQKLLLQHLIHRIAAYREQGSRQVALQIDWAGAVDPPPSRPCRT